MGILVDVGFLPFRDKERLAAYAFAGGLASASNVFVFQLFASPPADVLADRARSKRLTDVAEIRTE